MRAPVLLVALFVGLLACQALATNYGFHLRNAVPTGNHIHDVVAGKSAIVATGGDNLILVSWDGGMTWTHVSDLHATPIHNGGNAISTIAYSPVLDIYLICGVDYNFANNYWLISAGNASSWKDLITGPDGCEKLQWGNGMFVHMGDNEALISTNAVDWSTQNVTRPEQCLGRATYCQTVSPHYYSSELKAWIAIWAVNGTGSLLAASKDAFTWSTLLYQPRLEYLGQEYTYFYDAQNLLVWHSFFNGTYYTQSYNVATREVKPAVVTFAGGSPTGSEFTIKYAEVNNTLFWVLQNEFTENEVVYYNTTIMTSLDGFTWLYNNSFESWSAMTYVPTNDSFVAVGSEGLISIGSKYGDGHYYFNRVNTIRYYADFKQVIWIDSLGEYVAGPTLMTSKTAHKWDLLDSEIDVPLADWKYIPQSPYAQFFGIGDQDHYILTGQNPKRWSAFYVPEIRSHKPVMSTICSNGGPSPSSVLVLGYYTRHEDAMTVRSLDGGQTWTNIYYFQPGAPIRHCTYGNGIYVGLTHHPHVYTSLNGSIWHKVGVLNKEAGFQALAFYNNQFVAVGDNCTIVSSPDGVNWMNQTIQDCSSALNGVSWSSAVGWMVVGEDGVFYTSPDLVNWTYVPTSVYGSLRGVAYSDALSNWVIVGPKAMIMSQIISG